MNEGENRKSDLPVGHASSLLQGRENGATRSGFALPDGLFPLPPITVIVGHYGVGKTNLSLNMAVDAQAAGQQVGLIDLDIVNPYFRSSEYSDLLSQAGVELVSPTYAGSTLDSPSLSGRIDVLIDKADSLHPVILDVGGDDVGSTALGRYAAAIREKSYRAIYVINAYRNLTQTPEEATALVDSIEAKSDLKITDVVNNSHLGQETALSTIERTLPFAENVALALQCPLVATTIPQSLMPIPKSSASEQSTGAPMPYLVQVYVRPPWEA